MPLPALSGGFPEEPSTRLARKTNKHEIRHVVTTAGEIVVAKQVAPKKISEKPANRLDKHDWTRLESHARTRTPWGRGPKAGDRREPHSLPLATSGSKGCLAESSPGGMEESVLRSGQAPITLAGDKIRRKARPGTKSEPGGAVGLVNFFLEEGAVAGYHREVAMARRGPLGNAFRQWLDAGIEPEVLRIMVKRFWASDPVRCKPLELQFLAHKGTLFADAERIRSDRLQEANRHNREFWGWDGTYVSQEPPRDYSGWLK